MHIGRDGGEVVEGEVKFPEVVQARQLLFEHPQQVVRQVQCRETSHGLKIFAYKVHQAVVGKVKSLEVASGSPRGQGHLDEVVGKVKVQEVGEV